ncbi:ESF1 homolog [Brevipalpus obovatus]|uniref:ESF1 homolog n=1 Tax=Brevipalpus obovatus TaxID=246614 RepID=UPI003D9DEE26
MPKEEVIDERFKQVLTDPRFKTLSKKRRRIKVDSRFKSMFDKKFNGGCLIDKRGRKVNRSAEKTLKKFYEVSSEEEEEGKEKDCDDDKDEDNDENIKSSEKEDSSKAHTKSSSEEESEDEETSSVVAGPSTSKSVSDLRGEYNDVISSSSDEESSEGEAEDEEEIDHNWGELDKDAPRSEEITNRLAVCNLDWDRIKAQDIFVLFNSFKSETGEVRSAKIFPSQFGKERMEEEKLCGPKELTEIKIPANEEDPYSSSKTIDDDDVINTDSPFVSEKLRQYQINRLKYFYAVVECDTAATAAGLYDQLNGMEYESSASTLDVRVIPDDVSFDEEEPISECYSMPSLVNYHPPTFITTALQQSKVQLTWDETDPERSKTFQKAFTNQDKCADDLAVYLASSSSEGESDISDDEDRVTSRIAESKDDQDKIEKYKNLLRSLDEEKDDEKDIDMEVTWEPGLENIGKEILEKKEKEKMTVFERERIEKKSKKAKGKSKVKGGSDEESVQDDNAPLRPASDDSDLEDENIGDDFKDVLGLLTMDETNDKKHFDYDDFIENNKSKRKKKRKKKDTSEKVDNFEFDAEDPRFSAVYNSHQYNIDQSSSHFKKTKAIDEMLQKKANKPEPEKPKKPSNLDNLKSFVERAKAKTSMKRKWGKS